MFTTLICVIVRVFFTLKTIAEFYNGSAFFTDFFFVCVCVMYIYGGK